MKWTNEIKSYDAEKCDLYKQIALFERHPELTIESRSIYKPPCVQTASELIAEIKLKIANLDNAIEILKSS